MHQLVHAQQCPRHPFRGRPLVLLAAKPKADMERELAGLRATPGLKMEIHLRTGQVNGTFSFPLSLFSPRVADWQGMILTQATTLLHACSRSKSMTCLLCLRSMLRTASSCTPTTPRI